MIFRAQEQLRKTYGYLLTEEKTALPSLNGIPGRQDENWIFQNGKGGRSAVRHS